MRSAPTSMKTGRRGTMPRLLWAVMLALGGLAVFAAESPAAQAAEPRKNRIISGMSSRMLDLASKSEFANQAITLRETRNGPSYRCFTEPLVG